MGLLSKHLSDFEGYRCDAQGTLCFSGNKSNSYFRLQYKIVVFNNIRSTYTEQVTA